MKKIFLALLTLGLLGCPTDKDPVVTDAGTNPVIDASDVIVCDEDAATPVTKDNWQLVLPAGWVEQTQFPNSQNVALLAANEKDEGLFLLTKEPYTDSFDEFAIETIRGLRDQGADILTTSSVPLGDEQFVYVNSKQDSLVTDTWLTVKDGSGYSLNCGALEDNYGKLSKDCQDIFSSFKVE